MWRIDSDTPPRPSDRTFTALVNRIACSGGVTGEVLAPTVTEQPDRILIGFSVNALPHRPYSCVGNPSVKAEVRLDTPIGERQLVDTACDARTAGSIVCFNGGVRWPDGEGR